MAILADWQIRRLCVDLPPGSEPLISPYSPPVSENGVISFGETHGGYDLRLGNTILVFKNTFHQIISPKRSKEAGFVERVFDRLVDLKPGQPVVIPSNSYILGYSLERICVPRHLKGRCVGKSSLARCGILLNCTPLEPGWKGYLTLEIANVTPCPVEVYVGEGICQVEFDTLAAAPDVTYGQKAGAKYQDQGAEPVIGRVKE